jgi:ATP-dependent Clp endopeptidase proteolytic subunit ClpP
MNFAKKKKTTEDEAKEQKKAKPASKTKPDSEEQPLTLEEMLASSPVLFLNSPPEVPQDEVRIRNLTLYGDLAEDKAAELCFAFNALKEMGKYTTLKDPKDETSEIITAYKPIDFTISTCGGGALDMFAIYDTMRMVREKCDIQTLGIGKVMSAGVLLLAGGTKGKRRITRNCRVMLHSVVGGSHGSIHNLENEMDEVRWIQDKYSELLCAETDMTRSYLKKILGRKVNVYLTAEEAVELGIADEVV